MRWWSARPPVDGPPGLQLGDALRAAPGSDRPLPAVRATAPCRWDVGDAGHRSSGRRHRGAGRPRRPRRPSSRMRRDRESYRGTRADVCGAPRPPKAAGRSASSPTPQEPGPVRPGPGAWTGPPVGSSSAACAAPTCGGREPGFGIVPLSGVTDRWSRRTGLANHGGGSVRRREASWTRTNEAPALLPDDQSFSERSDQARCGRRTGRAPVWAAVRLRGRRSGPHRPRPKTRHCRRSPRTGLRHLTAGGCPTASTVRLQSLSGSLCDCQTPWSERSAA